MKAFVVDKYEKKGAVRLATMPEPEVRDDDVLVRIHATAVKRSRLQDQGWGIQAHPAVSSAFHSGS
ncbi:D-arabinose 1-dehydrogenase-like Zn-dependent alcohol dehydrogenase [Bradyrhizobium sp. JR3.5]